MSDQDQEPSGNEWLRSRIEAAQARPMSARWLERQLQHSEEDLEKGPAQLKQEFSDELRVRARRLAEHGRFTADNYDGGN